LSLPEANNDMKKHTLENWVTTFSEAKADVAKTGWFFWFEPKSLTGGINLKMTYVDKLTGTHDPHQHAGEEILYLIEGQAEVHINGETRIINPNTSVYYSSYSLHCLKRVNDQPIRYLVINP
jgi:quercetin dioxygenase-like cupin family protein